jgi:hypothetical protein
MKSKLILFAALLLLAACATQPIATQIAGKSLVEQKEILVDECKSESWRGHDTSSRHRHYSYLPENKAHSENMRRICKALAEPNADIPTLLTQCRVEAKNGTYGNETRFKEHADRLTEICNGFSIIEGGK